VVSDYKSLKNGYRAHGTASAQVGSGSSGWMLLFYCVECGLKAELAYRSGKFVSNQLEANLQSHDLRRLAKELNIPPPYISGCHTQSTREYIEPNDLHLAWRYGRVLDAQEQSASLDGLGRLQAWCKESLGT